MIPAIPIIIGILAGSSVGLSIWYVSLSEYEKEEANEKANRWLEENHQTNIAAASVWQIVKAFKHARKMLD